jgi:hypothetical protein
MALDSYVIKFFAWCNENHHDKVWGYVEFKNAPTERGGRPLYSWEKQPGSLYNFWGRRGKTYSFKRHFGSGGAYDLEQLARRKTNPSGDKEPYRRISVAEIEKVCPGFIKEFEDQLLMAKFSDKVKSDDTENNSFI